MALFVCAILYMLVSLCEALDARAAAVSGSVAAPAMRDCETGPVPAVRSVNKALPGAGRLPRLALVPDIQAVAPKRKDVPRKTAASAAAGPWLPWPLHLGPGWAVSGLPMAVPWKNKASAPAVQHGYFVRI